MSNQNYHESFQDLESERSQTLIRGVKKVVSVVNTTIIQAIYNQGMMT